MIGLADENGRTYECDFGTYSKDDGFVFNETAYDFIDFNLESFIGKLFHDNLWKLKQDPVKEMSLADIEKELGYRVRIVDPEPNKEKVSKKSREETDALIDMWGRILGLY